MPMIVVMRIGLRFEGRFDIGHGQAQPQQQIAQRGSLLQVQVVRSHLDRRMAVAQVISRLQQDAWIDAGGAQDRLGRGNHSHQAAVFRDQGVAVAQHRAAGQCQGDLVAIVQGGG